MMRALLLALAASSAVSALAQPPARDTIDVIGLKPEDVRKETAEFIRKLGVTVRPVARWAEPVCPKVFGVAPKIGQRVADKIRAAAREAGVKAAREPCRTNIVVSFTGDGGTLTREIAAKAPARLAEVAAEDRTALLNGNAPIRWWHATEMRTRDGMGTTGNEQPPFAKLDGPGGVPMAGEVHSSTDQASSARKWRACSRPPP
jgi:hypothetical protein